MICAVGIDAAFANMGFARAQIVEQTNHGKTWHQVDCLELKLVSTVREDKKVVRKSSSDLKRAIELKHALVDFCTGAQIAFVEVPSGSMSAGAARALGIAVGVLASCPIPIIEVSPMEVKRLFDMRGRKAASKTDIIEWAVKQWPKAPWVRHERRGKGYAAGDLQNCNEHLADAMATIMAGMSTPAFQQLMSLHHAIPSTPLRRRFL